MHALTTKLEKAGSFCEVETAELETVAGGWCGTVVPGPRFPPPPPPDPFFNVSQIAQLGALGAVKSLGGLAM